MEQNDFFHRNVMDDLLKNCKSSLNTYLNRLQMFYPCSKIQTYNRDPVYEFGNYNLDDMLATCYKDHDDDWSKLYVRT